MDKPPQSNLLDFATLAADFSRWCQNEKPTLEKGSGLDSALSTPSNVVLCHIWYHPDLERSVLNTLISARCSRLCPYCAYTT